MCKKTVLYRCWKKIMWISAMLIMTFDYPKLLLIFLLWIFSCCHLSHKFVKLGAVLDLLRCSFFFFLYAMWETLKIYDVVTDSTKRMYGCNHLILKYCNVYQTGIYVVLRYISPYCVLMVCFFLKVLCHFMEVYCWG